MTAASYNNGSPTCGGAVYLGGQSTNSVSGCTFTGNIAFNGGAVYCAGGSSTSFLNNVFTSNYARYSTSYGYGGGIMIGAGSATFNRLNFTNNRAIRGGGISINSGLTYAIYNSKFENNTAYNYGGAVNLYGKVSFQSCNFTSNIATKYGGAVFNTGTQDIINFKWCRFVLNKALDTSSSASYGGAIASSGISSQINVRSSVFNSNQANRGGAISSRAENIFWIIENNRFNNNNVSQHGGAICILKESNIVKLENNNFTQNRANTYGGAILGDGSNSVLRITSCNFTRNVAGKYGGAIFNQKNTTITGTNNSYKFNSVTSSLGVGGAICNRDINSHLYLLQEEYRNNSAINGTAIYNNATGCKLNCSILVGNGSLIYSNCSFNARFNWWGSNDGNNSCQGDVNSTNPVVFQFNVSNWGVVNHIRTIYVFVSVHSYNDSGVLRDLEGYIPEVSIVLSNNLGTIKTNFKMNVSLTLADSITTLTATLDNETLPASITSSKTMEINNLTYQYEDTIDLSDINLTRENEHMLLFVDEYVCDLTGLLTGNFSEIRFDNTSIVIENNTLKIKYYDKETHNVSQPIKYFDDETLEDEQTTNNIIGVSKINENLMDNVYLINEGDHVEEI